MVICVFAADKCEKSTDVTDNWYTNNIEFMIMMMDPSPDYRERL